jgi:hypothetical protein
LEETILALKSQIQSLQQRTIFMQSELEERHRSNNNNNANTSNIVHGNSNNSSYNVQNTASLA